MYYLVFVFVLISNISFAQPAFQSKDTQLLEQFHNKFGLPSLDGESARAWTMKLAEQFAFSFPDENWGTKSAGGGRPPSTDVIARNCCGGLWGYDVILSQGIAAQTLISQPHTLNLAGQVFISVSPRNHLGNNSSPPPPPPPVNLEPIYVQLSALGQQISMLTAKIGELDARLTGQIFELSDYARATDGLLGVRVGALESKPIPVGCTARFLGRGVGCNLVFP
jgi:hypothetical protein